MAKKIKRYEELKALKGKMRSEGFTYRRLSKENGISVDAINNKLNGYSVMDTDDVELMAKALNISADEILLYFFSQMLRNATREAV